MTKLKQNRSQVQYRESPNMLRGAGDSLTGKSFLVSWLLGALFVLVSWCHGFLVSWFQSFLESKFQSFNDLILPKNLFDVFRKILIPHQDFQEKFRRIFIIVLCPSFQKQKLLNFQHFELYKNNSF